MLKIQQKTHSLSEKEHQSKTPCISGKGFEKNDGIATKGDIGHILEIQGSIQYWPEGALVYEKWAPKMLNYFLNVDEEQKIEPTKYKYHCKFLQIDKKVEFFLIWF